MLVRRSGTELVVSFRQVCSEDQAQVVRAGSRHVATADFGSQFDTSGRENLSSGIASIILAHGHIDGGIS